MSEALQLTGAIAAASLVAVGLLAPSRLSGRAALLLALALAGALVSGQAWDGELLKLRSEPLLLAAAALAGGGVIAALALAFRRWDWGLPLALLAALPIRLPVDVGGDGANLLLPLYVVIVAGLVARSLGPRPGESGGLPVPRPVLVTLALAVLVYAIQAIYSSDAEFAARNVAFFLVPFAALFALLAETDWSPGLLLAALAVLGGESLVFALIGIVQHQAGEIFWNQALVASNDFHFYFRSNSIFWDPNIYGRYLCLAIVLLAAALVWLNDRSRAIAVAVVIAIIWVGLLFSFSQTSFLALLAGLAALLALAWSLRWTLIAAPVVAVAAVLAIVAGGFDQGQRGEAASESSGHSTLIEGGLELARERPVAGQGSASFAIAFRDTDAFAEAKRIGPARTTVSHNEPVTVAAEQGAIGLLIYLATLAAAAWALLRGIRSISPGLGGRPAGPDRDQVAPVAARIGIAAAFCALLVHTIGYAGYLSDPLSWALIAVGSALGPRSR